MIFFARAHAAVLDTWDAGKVAKTREAFDLHDRPLTRYTLNGGATWNSMTQEQMAQTIRAFKTGNASLMGKIVDNKKDEHWHRLPFERMAEISRVMETGSGLRRLGARHGKWV
jgi:hypothetical protein